MQRELVAINLASGEVARTIRSGYYKFGCSNLLFRSDGFVASCVLIEYDL